MLIARTRRDVVEAIKVAENVCHPIYVANADQSRKVAIRSMAQTVTFDNGDNVKWYEILNSSIRDITDWLLEPEMVEGHHFVHDINHGLRDCLVERLTPTRVRIRFEMPPCVQGGWRKTRDLFGRRFITYR